VAKPRKTHDASESTLKRTAKAVPWTTLFQVTLILGRRWAALSAKERARLQALVGKSRGRLGRLSARERMELRRLARKIDLRGMGGELMALGRGHRRRRVRGRERRR
jgi:hypothetical protein